MDWNNKEEVLKEVRKDGYNLKFTSDRLKNNPEIVLEAIKSTSYALKFAPDKFKNDREFIMSAVKENGDILSDKFCYLAKF